MLTSLVILILTTIQRINCDCTRYDTTCEGEDAGKYCSQISSTVDYTFRRSRFLRHNCNTKDFCQWASMWNNTCIRSGITKAFSVYYKSETDCFPITVPTILNVSVSCCSPYNERTFTCASQNSAIYYNYNDYINNNCVPKPEVAAVLEGIADCYMTPSFLNYLQCNTTAYNTSCPLFIFTQLQSYATCSCAHIVEMDNLYSLGGDSYKYFTELSGIVESELQTFGNWEENCPNYVFSCNADGDALLDLYEILCPLELEDNMNLNAIRLTIEQNVFAQSDEQVEMYEQWDVIRILMYSESEAWYAMDYLWSEQSIIPNNGTDCTMMLTKWNLKYPLPTYSQPTTPMTTESVESGGRFANVESDIMLIIVLVCVVILILVCVVAGIHVCRNRKIRNVPAISLQKRMSDKDNVQLVQSTDTLTSGEYKSGSVIAVPEVTGTTKGEDDFIK
eukprot:392020_1